MSYGLVRNGGSDDVSADVGSCEGDSGSPAVKMDFARKAFFQLGIFENILLFLKGNSLLEINCTTFVTWIIIIFQLTLSLISLFKNK